MTEANPTPGTTPESPIAAYRSALKRTDPSRLAVIARTIGIDEGKQRPTRLPERIAEFWSEANHIEATLEGLPSEAQLAMSLFALADTTEWVGDELRRALSLLGVAAVDAIEPLLEFGMLAARPRPEAGAFPPSTEESLKSESVPYDFLAHPSLPSASRTIFPNGELPPAEPSVSQIRQSDGLETLLHVAAIWQRLEEAPLRRTQQGAFFKRDRERLEDDPSLVGPITDSIEPMPDMAMLWIALAEVVGLVMQEPGTDRIIAAKPDFWSDNAIHLPQMLASRWLSLRSWHELGGSRAEASGPELTTVALRLPALLWLAKVEPEEWVALEDLVKLFDRLRPGWGVEFWPFKTAKDDPRPEVALLDATLLGPAYQLGLIRVGEERPSGRRLVQLTELGRYSLAIGPPPPPPPFFEHFLFVQPNFEIIAYRQGLTPPIIGKFSRFARWSKLGAAIELKLTAESVYRGLEGGLTPDTMLALLTRHSSRPLPPGIAEALRTWSSRRERVTYHGSATLVEFATPEELETALTEWPAGSGSTPIRVAPRLLLVDDVSSIPFSRFRQAGARDYRRPAEPCVEVGPDGVSLSIDLGRSDLLVDAEIARFADEQSMIRESASARRRFSVSRESLRRGIDAGLTATQLSRWFLERAGVAMPASIRLLLHAATPGGQALEVANLRVISAPHEDLLDGLLQHPATRDVFTQRLGPTHAVISEALWPSLQNSLGELGLSIDDQTSSPADLDDDSSIPEAPTANARGRKAPQVPSDRT